MIRTPKNNWLKTPNFKVFLRAPFDLVTLKVPYDKSIMI